MERWPCAVGVEELMESALDRAAPHLSGAQASGTRLAMTEDLFGAVTHGLISLHTQPPPCTHRPSNTPVAHPVAAFQAERGPLVVDAHHTMHQLDAVGLDILKLATGNRTRAEIADALGNQLDAARTTMDAAITALTRNALFVG
jgi:hypothetical protein